VTRRPTLIWIAIGTVALWLVYLRRLSDLVAVVGMGAFVIGGLWGMYVSRRRWWWLSPLPLVGFALAGLALSTHYPNTSDAGGDWSTRALVAFGGVWCGLIATASLVLVLALRAIQNVVHKRGSNHVARPTA
jgi:disulfide bond formation protein DsbB